MIRVRFAPSPTGYLHIGGLRTFLYNWLLVKKNQNFFTKLFPFKRSKIILRIEDTDRKRYVEGATESLIKTLNNLGFDWDEGPFLKENNLKQKGKFGPYIQSQRLEIYRSFAQKLIDQGKAYYCFCSEEDLEKIRQEQIKKNLPPKYDGRCRKLSDNEIKDKLKKKIPYVIRLKVPPKEKIVFEDLIYGKIEFDSSVIDDQILLKSDGWPTYHLANVVDDYLMKITHVIRGEEWLPSTPKHILLYQAFKWPLPKFAHLPLILNPDKTKLSKRKGDVAVEEFLSQGYLPEALINFIALLGWHPSEKPFTANREVEILSLKDLIKKFSLERIRKSPAIFDRNKLDWLNGYYIRKTKIQKLTLMSIPYLIQRGYIKPLKSKFKYQITKNEEIIDFNKLTKIIALEQERIKKISEIPELTDFFFQEPLNYNPNLLIWKKMTSQEIKENLNLIKEEFLKIVKWNYQEINKVLNKLAKKRGNGEIFWPLRVALTGKKASPPPVEIAEILGKEKTINRIEKALMMIK